MADAAKKQPQEKKGAAERSAIKTCPLCQAPTTYLRTIRGGKKACRDCARKAKSQSFAERYEEAKRIQQEKVKRQKWAHRIRFAKEGKKAFGEKNYKDGVIKYELYLRVLEEGFNLPKGSGKIDPEMFENQAEVLLMAAIYWDLLRVYDRSLQVEKKFQLYTRQFLKFSSGFPWQKTYAQNIARYIQWGSPTHLNEFKMICRALGGKVQKGCFIATACFGYDAPETVYFRKFRDDILDRYVLGKLFISFYYRTSPKIVEWFNLRQGLLPIPRKALSLIYKSLNKIWSY